MTNAQLAELLETGGHSLVVENGAVRTFGGRGVKDLLRLLGEEPQALDGARIADKVVGKAAAALMALGKVASVYAHTISTPAVALLRQNGVEVEFAGEVHHIINRDGTGWCPMEKACRDLQSHGEMLCAIKETIAELAKRKQTESRTN